MFIFGACPVYQVNSGIPLGSLPFDLLSSYQIGYIIFSEVGSQASSGSPASLLAFFFSFEFSSLPLKSLCIKSSTVGVRHQVAWIPYIENAVTSEHLICLCSLELGSAKHLTLFCTSVS